jgi:hypothetical protein
MRTVPLSVGDAAGWHRDRPDANALLTAWLAGARTKLAT